jgi:hypothetical protein
MVYILPEKKFLIEVLPGCLAIFAAGAAVRLPSIPGRIAGACVARHRFTKRRVHIRTVCPTFKAHPKAF